MQIYNQLVTAITTMREALSRKLDALKNQHDSVVTGTWTDDSGAVFERRQNGTYTDLSGNIYTPTGTPTPFGGDNATLGKIANGIGQINDAQYSGTGDASAIALLKTMQARLAGTLTVNEPNAARETTLQNLLRATQNIASSIWTDNSGAFYIQRQTVDSTTGQPTITYTDGRGNPATPGAGLRPSSESSSLIQFDTYWNAKISATGYTVGDLIAQLNVYDISTSPATQVMTAWINVNTGVTLTNAPPAAHIEPKASNIIVSNDILKVEAPNGLPLPPNAAKETGGNLEAIKTAAATLAKEATAYASYTTSIGILNALGGPSDLAWGGLGGASQNSLLKALYENSKPKTLIVECSTITTDNTILTTGTSKIRIATFENTGSSQATISSTNGSGSYALTPGKSIEFRAERNDAYTGFRVDGAGTSVVAIIERYQ